jgi:hypothetical protein
MTIAIVPASIRRSSLIGAAWIAAGLWCQASAQSRPGEAPQLKYEVHAISAEAGGLYVYAPEQWGMLRIQLTNPQDHPAEVMCITYFGQDSDLQFGRRAWVPPQSRLMTWHPVLLPPAASAEDSGVLYHTQVSPLGGPADALIRHDSGKAELSSTLRAVTSPSITGIVEGPATEVPHHNQHVSPFDLVMTARLEHGLSRQVSHVHDQFLPPVTEGLDALDTLVIATDQGRTDAAGLAAIRRWLYGGGNLWVMLDRVDPAWLEMLLGDEFDCQVVDRVGLTSIDLTSGAGSYSMDSHHADYELPVDLVRVVVDDSSVVVRANGWPAAVRRQCGEGQLLVTTLGADAWAHPRTPRDFPPPGGRQVQTNYAPNPPLFELIPELFSGRRPPLLSAAALEPRLREYVGYEIPSQGVVVGVLAAFCLGVAAGGLWLSKTGRLEWLGLLAPTLALAAGGVLAGIGSAQRGSVPPVTAILQFVRPIPGTDDVQMTGAAGIYATSSGTAELSGVLGGRLVPDMSGMEGTTRRMVWDDLGRWRWEFVPRSPGLRTAVFATAAPSRSRVEVRSRFDERGLVGQVLLPPALRPEDAIVATRNGRIGVDINPDGTFRADTSSVLTPEQFLGADLFGDEQHRRQQVLAELLADPATTGFPTEPTLLFWTAPWDDGFQFDPASHRTGSALVAMPLKLERPAAGTEMIIPAPMLTYREGIGPDGLNPAGLFNNRRLIWEEKSSPSSTWILIQVPQKLLPLAPSRARLTIRVSGPVGRLEIAGFRDGAVSDVQTWVDPVGTLTTNIEDPHFLELSANGTLALRVSGGDPDRPELTSSSPDGTGTVSYWRIESLDVELQGTIAGPAASQPQP